MMDIDVDKIKEVAKKSTNEELIKKFISAKSHANGFFGCQDGSYECACYYSGYSIFLAEMQKRELVEYSEINKKRDWRLKRMK